MHIAKCIVSRVFLTVEIMIFVSVYFFGSNGMAVLSELERENAQLEADIDKLRSEIQGLELDIVQWNEDPYYKEKIAREQLQMARADDQIIFVQ